MWKKILAVALLITAFGSFAEKKIPLENFVKFSEFGSVKISPKGDYLAATTVRDGKQVLVVLQRDTMKLINVVQFDGDKEQVGGYNWVSKDRLVLQKTYMRGAYTQPSYHGELLGVNADGSKSQYLMGHKAGGKSLGASSKADALRASSLVLDPLVHDDNYFLAEVHPWLRKSGADRHSTVYLVDVYTGKRRKVTRSPAFNAQYITDGNGEVRFSVSSNDYIDQEVYKRDVETGEWTKFNNSFKHLSKITPRVIVDGEDNAMFVTASEDGAPIGLYKIDFEKNSVELVSKDPVVNIRNVYGNEKDGKIYAVEYENGYPAYEFVDGKALLSKRLKGLLQALPGHQVQIVSSTPDELFQIVIAYNDRNPGDYYIMHPDEKTGKPKIQYLFSARSWINPDLMASTRPVKYTTRDGIEINGYLTVPKGKAEKNLPLIVMPHGGPHGPRDYWGFDPEAQMLASRGLAVLKVNFRGSGGYGPAFEKSGHGKWGTEIQYDIIDGTKYLIDQGIADKNNICIMGASFGGYSALMSPIIEPDLYKCAVGVVGVYDLPLMFKEGDVQERRSGDKYLKAVLGQNVALQESMSPSYNIDKLKVPVLIAHGGMDQRAPIEQAESLIAALEKEDHPYEYLLFEKEGHGFYLEKNRLKYFKRVLKFLGKHIDF
ncbi:S9 family peptidase [Psychrosphaera sp. B3R10]|uniref:S9 family peptidase n=1 Tax=unclassified Psychrosphaera TaxID=2641570 RepID=UPI001C08BB20|nr:MULTISPECIES: S9 family peptidase [unclassified Psychrosphaera]MBU2883177.1 S9 family peptidase [Psychrosphaera sp. I2R16]MBU2988633.1 S9 family peptidase [Psychrosphaera sp. B3R10]